MCRPLCGVCLSLCVCVEGTEYMYLSPALGRPVPSYPCVCVSVFVQILLGVQTQRSETILLLLR